MSRPCGCVGIQIITPEPEANAPGRSALNYRAGSYATFYQTMLTRLSTLSLTVPSTDSSGQIQTVYPLRQLPSREPSDLSIALLDAWSVVADVLTFYQERIANEGYLPTATKRRSILELGRLVNYTPRPGVSASVYLAFTVQSGYSGTVPAGTRAQSIPGNGGQMPQFFETSIDLNVSDVWNDLPPRLTRPQDISATDLSGAKAGSSRSLYFSGLTTNLKVGDGIVIVAGGETALRQVTAVSPQPANQRTQVSLLAVASTAGAAQTTGAVAQRYIAEAANLFRGNGVAAEAVGHLGSLATQSRAPAAVVENLRQLQTVATERNHTRLGAWFSALLEDLRKSSKTPPAVASSAVPVPIASSEIDRPVSTSSGAPPAESANIWGTALAASAGPLSALSRAGNFITPLALPASLQPSSSVDLLRTPSQAFSAESDIAPRLLAQFHPAAAATLYQALGGITPQSGPTAYVTRVKCGIFLNNYAGAMSVTQTTEPAGDQSPPPVTTTTNVRPPTLRDAVYSLINSSAPALTGLPLDAAYDQIAVGSYVAIVRPELDGHGNSTGQILATYHLVESIQTVSRQAVASQAETTAGTVQTTYVPSAFSAKVTQLSLQPPWLHETTKSEFELYLNSTLALRETVVYAQAEELPLAEEPLDGFIEGTSIELDGVYAGLESGRWIIVAGTRTDIPGTTGVSGSEVAMIAGVSQESPSSPMDTVHTKLVLANKLAFTYEPSTVKIYGNVAEATNGQSVGEVLGNGNSRLAFQTFALHQSPLTYLSAVTPSGAQSTLTVTVNEIAWQETDDLSMVGPSDHAYTTQTDDSGQTTVIFGNGTNGARVPTGTANVKAVYRYGMGAAGNADARRITQLTTQPGGIQLVTNPLPASGGADPDSASQARANAPLAVKALDRLVSVRDYADFSLTYAGIGKAAAVKLSNGRRQIVFITIAGAIDIPIALTSDLCLSLGNALRQFGDPQLPVLVGVRNLKLLVIAAGIQVARGYQFEDVEPNVQAALLATFSFENRNLGQPAFLSEAIGSMQAVLGVAFVNISVFDSVASDATAQALASLGTTLIRHGYISAKPAHVNSSLPAADSQAGLLIQPAELIYLTPDIPDTLILTEITRANPGPIPQHRKTSQSRIRRAGAGK